MDWEFIGVVIAIISLIYTIFMDWSKRGNKAKRGSSRSTDNNEISEAALSENNVAENNPNAFKEIVVVLLNFFLIYIPICLIPFFFEANPEWVQLVSRLLFFTIIGYIFYLLVKGKLF